MLWIMGAGAVGGYMAVHLARAGHAVHVVDSWAEHVDAIASHGLSIEEPSGNSNARVPATLMGSPLPAQQPDAIVLACKIGATAGILDWLEDEVGYRGPYIATLNGLADDDVASRVGAERVVGCIVTGFHGELRGPGLIVRHAPRGGDAPVFKLGEVAGPISQRVREWTDTLSCIDRAVAVDDLRADRWTKLQYNAMTSALCAITQRPVRALCHDPATRGRMIDIGLEIVALAHGQGLSLGKVCGIGPEVWRNAATGDATARAELEMGVARYGDTLSPTAMSGSAQDRAKGRASEVDVLNGAVVRVAERRGRDAPANRAVRDELVAIERAEGSR